MRSLTLDNVRMLGSTRPSLTGEWRLTEFPELKEFYTTDNVRMPCLMLMSLLLDW